MAPAGHFRIVEHRWAQNDLRSGSVGRFGKQTRPLQAPFVRANLGYVDNIARLERHPVQHRLRSRVPVVSPDVDHDSAHSIALALVDVVNQIKLARLIGTEKSWIGSHLGEDISLAAIQVLERVDVLIHRRLIEELPLFEPQFFRQRLGRYPRVTEDRKVANLVARALVDNKGQREPATIITEVEYPPHFGAEIAKTSIIGGNSIDVLVNLQWVDVASE